jgi:response regulator RpfG family c-di-GMP phosphodiesterase
MQSQVKRSAVVVDDDIVYLQTVGLMLKKMGFSDVKMFSNALDALDFVESEKTDLIVSDWDMPMMTGCEFLEEVRRNPRTNSIPFILNTGNHSETYWRQAIAAGVTEFLFKPFGFADFKDSVSIALDLADYDRGQQNARQKKAS